MAEAWELKKTEVIQQLLLLDNNELTAVCVAESIVIPPAKKDDKSAILNLLLGHVSREEVDNSEDRGLQLFEGMDTQIKGILSKRVKAEGKTAPVTTNSDISNTTNGKSSDKNDGRSQGNSGSSDSSDSSSSAMSSVDSTARLHLSRLKDFKIHGGFVASGDNPISYSNLKFQMKEGKEMGYKEKEIMSGVVKAIKPSSDLHEYLESELIKGTISLEVFLKHIKNHYALRDSSTLMRNLENSKQGPNQKTQAFITQMAQLRNNILTISEEEGNPRDPMTVRKRFLHAIAVGLKRDTVRLEVQALVKANPSISDADLGAEVQLIMAREEEHDKKHGTGDKDAVVNSMAAENKAIQGEIARLNARFNDMSASKDNEIVMLQGQVHKLESRLSGGVSAGNYENAEEWSSGWDCNAQDGATYHDSGYGYGDSYAGNNGGHYTGNNGSYGPYGGNRGGSYGSYRGGYSNFGNRGGSQGNNFGGGSSNSNRGGFSNRGGKINRGNNFNNNRGGFNNHGGGRGAGNRGNNRGAGNGGGRGGGMLGGGNGGAGNFGNFGRGGNSNRGGRGGNRGANRGAHLDRNGMPFLKCEKCYETDSKCNHCTICGELGHQRAVCPKNI